MRRFFSDDSFWNTPLKPDPEIDVRNEHVMALLEQEPGGPVHINLDKYTIPVYLADASTPRVTVHQRVIDYSKAKSQTNRWGRWSDRRIWWRHGPGFGRNVPMPANAVADSESDHHLAIVDWSTGTAWDGMGHVGLLSA